jgi:transposase
MARQDRRKRRYSPGFKLEAVRLMHERLAAGDTLRRVSEELEVGPDLLRVWAKDVAAAGPHAEPTVIWPGHGHKRPPELKRVPVPPPSPPTKDEELARLRRENERLRMERDFLKKAAAFFAKESQ